MVPVYLERYLEPLAAVLARADVTDIFVNRPGEIWIETREGAIERHDAPGITATGLDRLARQIAAIAHQGVSREHPILSATLPEGARVQIVAPPATRGPMALAIRKHVISDLTIDDYADSHAFDTITPSATPETELHALLRQGNIADFLKSAVRGRLNIVVSGGTSTGKTTFVNALLKEIPRKERLILIEDAPELVLVHPNAVGLVAVSGEMGEAKVSSEDLLRAALRMRPDRIILGELRGGEAFSFLRAINTGHPGSITTLHADSPAGAIEQIALLMAQHGSRLARTEIIAYAEAMIDIFIQLERRDGRRRVADIRFRGALNPSVRGQATPAAG